ncbi:MAG: competence/damage-inducible protein A [Rhodobacterales bacterium]|nr:MAG: competence/damage-inducible protein A [Rhodobacterales bacterium]
MMNPTAAMLVIGDEILSGRTQDTNSHFLAGELTKHGIDLTEIRVVRDDTGAIIEAVQRLAENHTHLFTSGGIGPTHDDITADAVAAAFGTPIGIRDDARALLEAHYTKIGAELNAARLRMARIPENATLIDNPISAAPGFSLHNVHVMAGVPMIFKVMVTSLLPGLVGGTPLISKTLRLNCPEGVIAEPLGQLSRDFPDVSFGSYPFYSDGVYGTNIVLRGDDAVIIDAAITNLSAVVPAECK